MTNFLNFIVDALGAYLGAVYNVVLVPLVCICLIFGVVGVIKCIR